MTKIASSMFIAALLGFSLHGAPAQAQLARTFVSSFGNDANDCNRLTPCRTLQRAHDNTLPLGEITILDPGGYGAVTINRGISVINDGVGEAGVLVSGGANGITIQAGANDKVSLRGLTIKGIGFGGGNGIRFLSGKSLTIENCVVRNLTANNNLNGFGIIFSPSTDSSSLTVSNTLVADNDVIGIWVIGGPGAVKAVFNRVEAYNNSTGIDITGSLAPAGATLYAMIADSMLSNHTSAGISSNTVIGHATTFVTVMRSIVANNVTGIRALATFTEIGQTTITGSALSVQGTNGALVESFGDNYIVANTDGNPAIPNLIPKK